MSRKILITISILVFTGALLFVYSQSLLKNDSSALNNQTQNEEMTNTSTPTNLESEQENQNSQEEAQTQDDNSNSSEESNQEKGRYIPYSSSSLTDKINIIFFAANWCPSCRILDQNLTNSQSDIPSNVTILKANFDTEQELRVKYGVTIQHTLVQVDKEGNQINKWNGLYSLNTLDDVLNLI